MFGPCDTRKAKMFPKSARLTVLIVLSLLPAASALCVEPVRISADDLVGEIFRIRAIKSFMVQQGGELLVDAHRKGMRAGRATNIKSASKSIISLLVGIAIEQGHLDGVQQPIGEFFPQYFESNPDPEKQAITIQDLLTMRAGLASTSRRNYGRWVVSPNWAEYVLDQPLVDLPGGDMIYSTGSSHLLSVILTRATGMSTREYANRYLFGPLGIRDGGWDRDPQGYYFGGNNLALSPSAMLRIGALVLNKGVHGDQQVVPAAWIEESMQVYTRSHFNPYDFGYLWWQRELNGYTLQFAWGNNGQYIMIVPALETVVAIASSAGEGGVKSRPDRHALFDFIETRLIAYLRQEMSA